MKRFSFILWLVLASGWSLSCSATECIALKRFTVRQVCGQVRDPSGSTIPGATIKVTSQQARGTDLHTQSDNAGNFSFDRLNRGDYTIRVDVLGFVVASQDFEIQRPRKSTDCKRPLVVHMNVGGGCSVIIRAKQKDIKQ